MRGMMSMGVMLYYPEPVWTSRCMCWNIVLWAGSARDTPSVGLGRLQKLHRKRSLIRNVGTLFEGRWKKGRCVGSTLGRCRKCVVNGYIPYPPNLCSNKFASLKHSFMFDEGTSTPDLCPPGMMCKLDCPWLSLYLFVCLGKWPVGIRAQSDLAIIRGFCWEPGGFGLLEFSVSLSQ